MNAFDSACKVEDLGRRRLAPWLDYVCEGRVVWLAKGALAEMIQRKFDVDAMVATGQFTSDSLECKFLMDSQDAPFERWSNFVEFSAGIPDYDRCTPGWGMTSEASLVLVYTISTDLGVVGRLADWRVMLHEKLPQGLRRWQLYDRQFQAKRQQLNRTVVFWTPPADLIKYAGFERFSARQLEIFGRTNPFRRGA